jgi:hypothetical protein
MICSENRYTLFRIMLQQQNIPAISFSAGAQKKTSAEAL